MTQSVLNSHTKSCPKRAGLNRETQSTDITTDSMTAFPSPSTPRRLTFPQTVIRLSGWILFAWVPIAWVPIAWVVIAFSQLFMPQVLIADTFHLTSGGQLKGKWLNPSNTERFAEIETENGVRLQILRTKIERITRHNQILEQYEQLVSKGTDSVEHHWAIAEWCRLKQLPQHRENHLLRILELDTNHGKSRRALGYRFVRGNWVTEEEFRDGEGYDRHDGRWRTKQERQLAEEKRQHREAERKWHTQLSKWREELVESKSQQIAEQIRSVRDPVAVPALANLLFKERFRPIKLLYIDALSEIKTAQSRQVLVYISLNDPDEEIFHESLIRLVRLKHPEVTDAYVDALESSNNAQIARAGIALRKSGDSRAIAPLIDALVTTHTTTFGKPGSNDAITTSFSSQVDGAGKAIGNPSSGLSTGSKIHVVHRELTNQEVLHALVTLSGGTTFGFNEEAWRRWYAIEAGRINNVNPRRDK